MNASPLQALGYAIAFLVVIVAVVYLLTHLT